MNAITTRSIQLSRYLINTERRMNALLFFQIFKELVLETTFEQTDKCERHDIQVTLLKGGDPVAPSGTTTLLRLHPSHETHRGRRPPCG